MNNTKFLCDASGVGGVMILVFHFFKTEENTNFCALPVFTTPAVPLLLPHRGHLLRVK